MSVKQAAVHFTEESIPCPSCGHPHLQVGAEKQGSNFIWFAYCPACRRVQEHASIPDSFTRGLPTPSPRLNLH